MSNKKVNFNEIPPILQAPLPEWVIRDYPEAVDDMANDIYSAVFWGCVDTLRIGEGKKAQSKPDDMTSIDWYHEIMKQYPERAEQTMINARVIVESLIGSANTAGTLVEKSERARFYLLYQLHVNNRWAVDEYNSFEEFVNARLVAVRSDSERSDLIFMIKQFVPMMKQLTGEDWAKNMKDWQKHYSRVRAGTPAMRDVVEEVRMAATYNDKEIEKIEKKLRKLEQKKPKTAVEKAAIDAEVAEHTKALKVLGVQKQVAIQHATNKFTKRAKEIADVITNPEIPVNGPNGVRRVLSRGKVTFNGWMSVLKDKTVFVFSVPSNYGDSVESALGSFIEFTNTDPKILPTDLRSILED